MLASQLEHGLHHGVQEAQPAAPYHLDSQINQTLPGSSPQPGQPISSFSPPPSCKVPLPSLETYLNIYHHKLYPTWPVVDKDILISRLQGPDEDLGAYALATAVCAATIVQLQLSTEAMVDGGLAPASMVAESEVIRTIIDYQENICSDVLLISFFLHVYYMIVSKRHKSTLLLRESITFAHLLGLHQESHYTELPLDLGQRDLRIFWLLFITERCAYSMSMATSLNSDLSQGTCSPARATGDHANESRTTNFRSQRPACVARRIRSTLQALRGPP